MRREMRRHKRGYRSYGVAYGQERPEHRAIARRLSPSGLFISTNDVVFNCGVELVLEIAVGDRVYRALGVVRHSLKVDSRFVRIMRPGMGVAFVEPPSELVAAIRAGG